MPREYQPIAPEDLDVVRARDVATDQIYDLRRRRIDLLKGLWMYLPKNEKGTRVRPEELITFADEGVELKELINWEYFERKAKKNQWDDVQREIEIAEVVEGLKLVLELTKRIGELESSGKVGEHFGMRVEEFGQAEDALQNFDEETVKREAVLEGMTAKSGVRDAKMIAAIRNQRRKVEEVKHNRLTYEETHPEAYYLERHRELAKVKEAFDKTGKIVETPYVRKKMETILSNLNRNTPVFIHGELGTGKTELAAHIARTRLSLPHVQRWEASHPMPDVQDKDELAEWAAERERQSQAILVHGHRGMESEELTAEREIAPAKVPMPTEQVKLIEEGWQRFRVDLEAQAAEGGEKLTQQRLTKLEDEYRKAHMEAFRRPVETRRVLRGVLLAMQEGRPVIIDEMNAIPHHVLIVLNDYLMRKPGDLVSPPTPDIPPFKVKEGFAVMATGNYKPEDGRLYAGRQQIDAAFLSRFAVVHYDYLPEKNQLEPDGLTPEDQREWRRNNELLMMMLARLLDRNMSLNLPEGALRQMEKLAMVARGIQDVFSGAEVSNAWFATEGTARVKPQDVLQENVLSLRHLLRILDRWHAEGYQYPLDVYLFEDFVSRSSARPKEMKYLYEMLQTQGDFFKDTDGWPNFVNEAQIQRLDVSALKSRYASEVENGSRTEASMETLGERQVIERLFGPAPARTVMAQEAIVAPEATSEAEDLEAQLEHQESLAMLAQTAQKADEMNQADSGPDFPI